MTASHLDLGVYVHFPFCQSRCPYCGFATEARATLPHEAYAAAVLAELGARAREVEGRRLRSIYFGGGTPGRWRVDRVAAVVAGIRAAVPARAPDLEVTLEANPGDLRAGELAALRAAGVNRLSLGIQSLDEHELRVLGRRCDRAGALAAIARARAAGFDNLSCDLMFALPGQTVARWRATLDEMCALAPEHLSVYNLTVEEATPFGARARAGRLPLPDEEVQVEMFELAHERLAAAGYAHYEISNYARPGREAVHNTLYWRGAEYLGLGAAAHSMRFLGPGPAPARIERRANPRLPEPYMEAAAAGVLAPASREELDLAAQQREGLWLGLRLLAGVERAAFRGRYATDPVAVAPAVCRDLTRQGLLEVTAERVRLTGRGLLFADEVAVALM
jgi:oxygen-independent coproporphyrinogen-3 oxidase